MIDRILEKLGIDGVDKLTAEERKTFVQWGAILGKADVTIDDLKKILPKEIERIEGELLKYDNAPKVDLYFKAMLRTYKDITAIIVTPTAKREALKAMLKQKYGIE